MSSRAAGAGPRVVLAAHYNSKLSVTTHEADGFEGATDADWHVALLVQLGTSLPRALHTCDRPLTFSLANLRARRHRSSRPPARWVPHSIATFLGDANTLLGSRHAGLRKTSLAKSTLSFCWTSSAGRA